MLLEFRLRAGGPPLVFSLFAPGSGETTGLSSVSVTNLLRAGRIWLSIRPRRPNLGATAAFCRGGAATLGRAAAITGPFQLSMPTLEYLSAGACNYIIPALPMKIRRLGAGIAPVHRRRRIFDILMAKLDRPHEKFKLVLQSRISSKPRRRVNIERSALIFILTRDNNDLDGAPAVFCSRDIALRSPINRAANHNCNQSGEPKKSNRVAANEISVNYS